MQSRHVVFDFDGTLISSMETVFRALSTVIGEHLERDFGRAELEKVFHHDPEVLFENLEIFDQIKREQLMSRWFKMTDAADVEYKLFDGVDEMLKQLGQKQYELYIWTARDRDSTLKILDLLDRRELFKNIRCATDCSIKPNPEGLVQMLGDGPNQNVIVIGDSYADICGANNFGCSSIGAHWCTTAKVDVLEGMGATYMANHPLRCLELIDAHFES